MEIRVGVVSRASQGRGDHRDTAQAKGVVECAAGGQSPNNYGITGARGRDDNAPQYPGRHDLPIIRHDRVERVESRLVFIVFGGTLIPRHRRTRSSGRAQQTRASSLPDPANGRNLRHPLRSAARVREPPRPSRKDARSIFRSMMRRSHGKPLYGWKNRVRIAARRRTSRIQEVGSGGLSRR